MSYAHIKGHIVSYAHDEIMNLIVWDNESHYETYNASRFGRGTVCCTPTLTGTLCLTVCVTLIVSNKTSDIMMSCVTYCAPSKATRIIGLIMSLMISYTSRLYNSIATPEYGVAVGSRIDKIIGLLCRILSLLEGSFAKETYNWIDPTNQSHLIPCLIVGVVA